ncbi:MAG: ImmA/IrrE family metallo-endopeptidase [archaeon]
MKNKKIVEGLVGLLRQQFPKEDSLDWKAIAEKYNFHYLVHKRFYNPVSGRFKDESRHYDPAKKQLGKEKKYFIAVPPVEELEGNEFATAHEIAHVLLGHCTPQQKTKPDPEKEAEANYFAQLITNTTLKEFIPILERYGKQLKDPFAKAAYDSRSQVVEENFRTRTILELICNGEPKTLYL